MHIITHVHAKSGIHVEITTEESSQPIAGGKSSTSSTGEIEDDDDNTPSLSSEQLARRPSFKSVGIYTKCNMLGSILKPSAHFKAVRPSVRLSAGPVIVRTPSQHTNTEEESLLPAQLSSV